MNKNCNVRKDLRIEICKDMLVDTFLINGDEKKLPKMLSSKVTNLSSNGLKFISQLDIPKHIGLIFNIQTDKEVIVAKASIIRKLKVDNEYSYGCEFIKSSGNQQKLRRYIYKEQLRIERYRVKSLSASV